MFIARLLRLEPTLPETPLAAVLSIGLSGDRLRETTQQPRQTFKFQFQHCAEANRTRTAKPPELDASCVIPEAGGRPRR